MEGPTTLERILEARGAQHPHERFRYAGHQGDSRRRRCVFYCYFDPFAGLPRSANRICGPIIPGGPSKRRRRAGLDAGRRAKARRRIRPQPPPATDLQGVPPFASSLAPVLHPLSRTPACCQIHRGKVFGTRAAYAPQRAGKRPPTPARRGPGGGWRRADTAGSYCRMHPHAQEGDRLARFSTRTKLMRCFAACPAAR